MSKCENCQKYTDCVDGSGLTWPCGAYVPKSMTRPLAPNEIIHVFENSRLESEHFTADAVAAAYVAGLAALRTQQEAEKNEPLTLEDLREMDGEPVWVTSTNNGRGRSWALVDRKYEVCREVHGGLAVFENYGKTWLAYRHKPEVYT